MCRSGTLISLGLIPRSLLRIKQSMVSIYTLKVGEMGGERQTCFSVFRLTPLNTPPLGAGMFIYIVL